jgi:hypothetical protein
MLSAFASGWPPPNRPTTSASDDALRPLAGSPLSVVAHRCTAANQLPARPLSVTASRHAPHADKAAIARNAPWTSAIVSDECTFPKR